ncbi:Calx-beta domain-containing protein, partial [Aquabacterium sp.]|uniref:Calx-beta domain-containing protein n=1 Tax=Aquabacterium sp. TaxID=1872578 RepID=UPI0025BB5E31
ITVPAGTAADQIVVRVPTTPDNLTELAETFKVAASTPENTAPVEGTGTITDATGTPTLAITGPADVNEAAGTVTYTVTLSNPSSTAVTVNYATADGTAKAGSDYTAATGTLTFAPGETSKTITVAITNDSTFEGSEAYQVKLSTPVGATLTTSEVTTAIKDDGNGSVPPGITPDDDRPLISVSSPQVTEGEKAVFTVALSHPSSSAQTLTLALTDGTAKSPSDYTSTMEVSFNQGQSWQTVTAGSVSVPANTQSLLVRVPTVNDSTTESSEAFTLKVSSTVAVNGSATGTATIIDNDAPPALDLDDDNSSGATGTGYTATYVENGTAVRISDLDIKVTDADSTQLTGATVKLLNPQAGDVLTLAESLPSGITATISGGVVTLTGAASLAAYQTAIHAIAFSNTGDNPLATARLIDVSVTDGTSTSNVATTTIQVTPVNDAPVVGNASNSVSEEGLSGGIADSAGSVDTTNATSVAGQIAISDADSTNLTVSLVAPTTPVYTTSGVQVVWVSDGAGGLIGKAGTAADAATVANVTINSSGQYTFTLSGSLQHSSQGEDTLSLNFGVKVSDGTSSGVGNLTISVEDDAPTAPAVQNATVAVQDTNLMVVLDVSGSMNDASGINGLTRLQAAIQSIKNLLDKYDEFGTVAVRLVTFSDTAQAKGDVWLSVADAKALLATISAGGGTNYDYALSAAESAFTTSAGKISGAQNVSYFFSDGNPTLSSAYPTANSTQSGSATNTNLGDGIDSTEAAAWTSFLNTYQINSYAIGLGSGVAQTYLNPIAYNGQFALDTNGTVVTNLSQLDSTLQGTVGGSTSGQIYASGSLGGPAVGADGGHLQSFTIDGKTYLYDATNPSLSVTTTLGGKFTLNWLTGDYTYTAPDGLKNDTKETFAYSIVDGDGDTATSSLVLNLVHNAPVAGAPTIGASEVSVSEEGLSGGVKDTAGTSDTTDATTATGHFNVGTSGGATVTAVSLTEPTTTLVTSSGKTVVWTSDNAGGLIGKDGTDASATTVATITVSKSGDYTFTLLQPVQHSGSGEDVLDLSFGVKVLDSSNKVGTGSLVVHIEDDSPVVPASAISQEITTIDTNLMIVLDVSGSMNEASGISGLTRLQAAIQSISNLLDKYDDYGSVAVRLVTFSDVSNTLGDTWLTVADAKALLAKVTATGGTNYDYALSEAQEAFAATAGKLSGAQTVSYFFSDGNPTLSSDNPTAGVNGQNGASTQTSLGDGISATEEASWISFLNANQIKSYAIGLGSGVSATYLQPIAYDGQASENLNGTVVTSLSQLDTVLGSTFGNSVGGNLGTSGTMVAAMGADGFAHVASITVDGVVHLYDAANPILTLKTTLGGDLTVNMDTGDYSYGAPGQQTTTVVESIAFALADKDGDTTTSTLAIQIDHTSVVAGTANADSNVGTTGEDFLIGLAGADTLSGGEGDDRLYGNAGNDVLNGGNGADVLNGGEGNDTLVGGAGADTLIGGPGNDTLTGGLGSDTFAWHFADAGTASVTGRATDTITDFNVASPSAGGDVLDLRDLLQGETTANLSNYLEFDTTTTAGTTIIKISTTGAFPSGVATTGTENERIVLENVNLRSDLGLAANATDAQVITKLLSEGKLLVDNG